MSWKVHCFENTLRLTKKCAKELFKAQEYSDEYGDSEGGDVWYSVGDVTCGEFAYFNPDHSEHIDWIQDSRLLEILLKHKVKGFVSFADFEGGGGNEIWRWEFDGQGNVKQLKGTINFE